MGFSAYAGRPTRARPPDGSCRMQGTTVQTARWTRSSHPPASWVALRLAPRAGAGLPIHDLEVTGASADLLLLRHEGTPRSWSSNDRIPPATSPGGRGHHGESGNLRLTCGAESCFLGAGTKVRPTGNDLRGQCRPLPPKLPPPRRGGPFTAHLRICTCPERSESLPRQANGSLASHAPGEEDGHDAPPEHSIGQDRKPVPGRCRRQEAAAGEAGGRRRRRCPPEGGGA